MSWTKDDQNKLERLRDKELAGTLAEPEVPELTALMARAEVEEATVLAPEMTRLRTKAGEVAAELGRIEADSEQLANLLAQQQALLADTHRFLEEFDRRHASILDGLARISRGP